MTPDPFNDLDPAQTVNVLPRHLAGPGPADVRTAWPFPFDADWTVHQPDQGTAFTVSPCMRLWTSFVPEPDKPSKGTWTTAANRVPFGQEVWRITFDATTPVELLHDVHTELLDLYHEDPHSDRDRLFEDDTAPHDAYGALFRSGWSHSVKTNGTQTFLSPDGLGGVRHQYATDGSHELAWRAWAGYLSEPQWQARFSFHTPTTLVAALTASMASTEPLSRTATEVPVHNRPHLYLATATPNRPPSFPPAAPPPPGRGPGRNR
ncbi:DUF317 domain-containing protein [Streptomyces sp. NPDC095613]|uniref:DUF317 domain-containing protein n=1 Tax=Streptomyces sp. NPDC095613 TaxID=3155540 RepID=UPI0033232ADD